nr:unnamed protein product [Digitaria exilis]
METTKQSVAASTMGRKEAEDDGGGVKYSIAGTWHAWANEAAVYMGLRRPDALAKATEELDRVGGGERHITEGDIATLPYLEAVVKETMRLHPVTPLLSLSCPARMWPPPAGTTSRQARWSSSTLNDRWRPDRVGEDAAAFRPERFAESSGREGPEFRGPPFRVRMCPDVSFGLRMVHGHAAVHRRRTQRPHPSPSPRCHLTLEDEAFESASAAAAPLPADGSPDDDWFTLLAASLPARTAEEMRRHYEALVEDVTAIQTGHVPLPRYAA